MLDFFDSQREQAFDPDVLDAFLGLLHQHGERWIAQPQLDRSRAAPASLVPGAAAAPAQRGIAV